MLKRKCHTIREINQQPELWVKVVELIEENRSSLESLINSFKKDSTAEVIFTGAGSSFFIGEMISPFFQKDTNISSKAVETTELVTNPGLFISKNKKTLLVSFARSGNSPESVAAIENSNIVCKDIQHLIITCNKDGALAKLAKGNIQIVVLPEEANDKSLAMTSSVTGMGLAALLLGRLPDLTEEKVKVKETASQIDHQLYHIDGIMKSVRSKDYDRVIFLGSGPMKGVARESHLKMQELTGGEIIGKFDSFLGFRHGPKAVVNKRTLLVYFCSNDEYVFQYELDLMNSINKDDLLFSIGIHNNMIVEHCFDVEISVEESMDSGLWTLFCLIPAQLLAFYKSEELGYNPDSPSKNGAIHRVVQGVTIYDFVEKSNGIGRF